MLRHSFNECLKMLENKRKKVNGVYLEHVIRKSAMVFFKSFLMYSVPCAEHVQREKGNKNKQR